jgi:N-acetylglutamate synthase-like GNAT family acetyltransferase
MDHVIRLARNKDIKALRLIERRASEMFSGTPHAAETSKKCLSWNFLRQNIRAKRLLVATNASDLPIGFAAITFVDGTAHLHELSVDPKYGEKGIGRALLTTVCAWARASRLRSVTLSTYRDVPWNMQFYLRSGFRKLKESELGPGLKRVRAEEAKAGLNTDARIFMMFDPVAKPKKKDELRSESANVRLAETTDFPHLFLIRQKSSNPFLMARLTTKISIPSLSISFVNEQISNKQLWVLTDKNDSPIAFAAAIVVDGLAHLHELSIDPSHGIEIIGSVLAEYVCIWAEQSGFDGITVSTFREYAWNMPMFKHLGFRPLIQPELTAGLRKIQQAEINQGYPIASRVMMLRSFKQ